MVSITNLNDDSINTSPGLVSFLDVGKDAVVVGDGSAFSTLDVWLENPALGSFAFDTTGTGLVVEERTDGTQFLTFEGRPVAEFEFFDGATSLQVNFNTDATAAAVQAIIRALTFQAVDSSGALSQSSVAIQLSTVDDWVSVFTNVNVLPEGAKVLTSAVEATNGTAGDDLWYIEADGLNAGDRIDGGGGNDTLRMIDIGTLDLTLPDSITGIETIVGSYGVDTFILKSTQLAGIKLIAGSPDGFGSNTLQVKGSVVNLHGTELRNITDIMLDDGATIQFRDMDQARYIDFSGSDITIDLSGTTLSETEINEFFRAGIVKVIDFHGEHVNDAPEMTGLDGDSVTATAGTPVFLDAGGDAVVADDAPSFWELYVSMSSGFSDFDLLALDTTGEIKLTGTNEIVVGDVGIGSLSSSGNALTIHFYAGASADLVQKLLHAFTYTYTGPADSVVLPTVRFELLDLGGKSVTAEVGIKVAPTGTVFLTPDIDVIAGTGDDTLYVATAESLNPDDQLDGGAGTDTLQLVGGGTFSLAALGGQLARVEKIEGDAEGSTIVLLSEQLAGIQIIDGGGGWDQLQIGGDIIDLTHVEIENIFTITLLDDAATIKFANRDAALKSYITGFNVTVDISSSGEALSEAELNELYQNGAKSIIDKNGLHTNLSPDVTGLHGDHVTVAPGSTVFIDQGKDAAVSDDSLSFKRLGVSVSDGVGDVDVLGIDTTDGVSVDDSGNVIVGGVTIGSLYISGTDALIVDFNENATKERVNQLLHALTYTYNGTDDVVTSKAIVVLLTDLGNEIAFSQVDVTVSPAGTKVLTSGTDLLTGTTGDDNFTATSDSFNAADQIDGAGGNDTLYLIGGNEFDLRIPSVLRNIETVVGSSASDRVIVDAARFAAIQSFFGGTDSTSSDYDMLELDGAAFDLRGKTIEEFELINLMTDGARLTVANKAQALNAFATSAQNTTLVLNGETLNDDERDQIFAHGITTVIDQGGTHTNLPAQLGRLDGDKPYIRLGETAFIDAGRNATLADDGTTMSALWISINEGGEGTDRLWFDTTGRIRIDGTQIIVDDTVIGDLMSISSATFLGVSFNNDATLARVQELIRALTYTDQSTDRTEFAEKTITITLADAHGRAVDATSTVEIVPEGQTPTNHKPTDVALSTPVVAENAKAGVVVGNLSASDQDLGDTPTFELLDNAGGRFALDATGTKIIVAPGAAFNYEAVRSYEIKVRATDQAGDSFEKILTVSVKDVMEAITGTSGKNRLKGGIGADLMKGGLGNDTLTGGLGNDAFLFNTKLNARTNVDKIIDFQPKADKIWLENAIFKSLGSKTGMLNKAYFTVGTKAKTKSHYIVYNKDKGILSFDADGSKTKYAPVAFAKVEQGLTLKYTDFLVV